ncbi:succinate dehydrogenase, hydrophobic membrane anchor protein [marine gamma proteobacterium HTCC2148]|jgi:succinate dehydrogenase / fumarate reductase membrane anchor subunit|nr:succinate dehydrogenase, hydrophobic membrane anchor protein [marine gamma proteobacterium HTCC2148]MBT3410206.1 succinate dehydrogenase, hydrophobic membrane anchor protein [Halieaceae bacterium]MBT5005542.1 succinate dehydrogenase, hydrophobic membrane anchor protein [Halieaceae bacterium]MBT6123941.1 succinate dehydrogenase, hydrophobic membrane anchor protein [Halieaceae bacterium]
MVKSVTSFGRSGLSDWLLQRVSGVILLAYAICLGGTLVIGVNYAQWQAMFASTGMRVFTLLAILSLAAHAWIGMWAVGTDYLTERMLGTKGNLLRLAFQIGCSLAIFVYVIWGTQILWG